MTRPVWLMDVDGVLNIIGWDYRRAMEAWNDVVSFRALGRFTISVSPRMLKTIGSWIEEGAIDLRWLTTWEDHANEELSPKFGWPTDLPVAGRRVEAILERPRKFSEDRDSYREDVGWWKLQFAQETYDSGVPVIWTDDEIGVDQETREWVEGTDPDRLLTVRPNAGLMPADLDRIGEFIKRWNDVDG